MLCRPCKIRQARIFVARLIVILKYRARSEFLQRGAGCATTRRSDLGRIFLRQELRLYYLSQLRAHSAVPSCVAHGFVLNFAYISVTTNAVFFQRNPRRRAAQRPANLFCFKLSQPRRKYHEYHMVAMSAQGFSVRDPLGEVAPAHPFLSWHDAVNSSKYCTGLAANFQVGVVVRYMYCVTCSFVLSCHI